MCCQTTLAIITQEKIILLGQYNWQQVKALPALFATSIPSYKVKIITLPFCHLCAPPSLVSKDVSGIKMVVRWY